VLAALAVAAVAVAGWRLLWFLTDDAFIAFRYAAQLVDGHGLVWNRPPFLPVEGYTSVLWVLLLAAVWKCTGVAPPQAANALSLAFGCGTLLLVAQMAERMALPPALARRRGVLTVLVLLAAVTNRTFLTWLSSGLETALFGFCITWWVSEALRPPAAPAAPAGPGGRSAFRLSTAAALAALARPDGLLAVAGTAVLLAGDARERGPSALRGAAPLLIVPAHFLWRLATYGAWLPNTYTAKVLGPWPEAGWRYAASFALENGLFLWALLALVAAGAALARGARGAPRVGVLVVVGVLGLHALYYTIAIGGDHFEYRVYSHLVPLFALSALWLAARVHRRPGAVAAWLLALAAAGQPIAWIHFDETRHRTHRRETHVLIAPVAHRFPAPLRPLIERFDAWQAWLIRHRVCMRRQEHAVFAEFRRRTLPTREEGARIAWDGRPAIAARAVGVLGWVLPNVAVIDLFGLNDPVIARSPPPGDEERLMAHARRPPPGYVECFRPNTIVTPRGEVRVEPRDPPLSDAEIRSCQERRWPAVAPGDPTSGEEAP